MTYTDKFIPEIFRMEQNIIPEYLAPVAILGSVLRPCDIDVVLWVSYRWVEQIGNDFSGKGQHYWGRNGIISSHHNVEMWCYDNKTDTDGQRDEMYILQWALNGSNKHPIPNIGHKLFVKTRFTSQAHMYFRRYWSTGRCRETWTKRRIKANKGAITYTTKK